MSARTGTADAATEFSKVAAVTFTFWIIKILCTTLGEAGGDAVTMGDAALKFGGLFEHQVHHQFNHTRHFLGAILCLMASGLLRLGEFFVTKGTAGVS